MNEIVKTALYHLTRSERPVATLHRFIAAKTVAYTTNGFSVRHAASRNALKKAAAVTKVDLDLASDTYSVTFYTTRGNPIASFTNVYADDLKDLFEHQTGLFLSFN